MTAANRDLSLAASTGEARCLRRRPFGLGLPVSVSLRVLQNTHRSPLRLEPVASHRFDAVILFDYLPTQCREERYRFGLASVAPHRAYQSSMMMKKGSVDAGLFLVRLALGVVFIAHGWQKFANMDATVGFFGTLGVAPFFAYLVAAVELLGGLAVLLGVFARAASALLVVVMVMAIILVKSKAGFFQGYEFDLTLLFSALAIAVSGAGCFALMRGEGACNCGGGSCGCGSEAPKA